MSKGYADKLVGDDRDVRYIVDTIKDNIIG